MIEELVLNVLENMNEDELQTFMQLVMNDKNLRKKVLEGVENENSDNDIIDCNN